MKFHITLLLFYASSLHVDFTSCCSNGWLTHDQSCYLFSHDTEAWHAALLMCREFGGQLVEIETEQENTFLINQSKLYGSPIYWTALNDLIEEGTWYWMNSKTPLSEGGYTDWQPGEPNNYASDENCAAIWTNYKWYDAPCHRNYRYICEKSNEPAQIIG